MRNEQDIQAKPELLEHLMGQLADLQKCLAQKDGLIREKDDLIAALQADNEAKRVLILELQRALYGRRSEKRLPEEKDGQLTLPFDDGDMMELEVERQAREAAAKIDGEAESRRQRRQSKERKRPERYRMPVGLPVEETTVYPEGYDERLHDVIGYTRTDKLGLHPASFYCKRTRYAVIRLKDEKNAPDPTIIKVDRSAEPLKGSYCSAGLAAEIIAGKFIDHQPEYRQVQHFKSLGVDIPLSTFNRWVHAAADALRPLYRVSGRRILQSDYLQVDETVTRINDTRGHTRQAYTWVVRDASPGHRGTHFFYDHGSRSRDVVVDYLADFRGSLQSDGYAAYSVYEDKKEVIPLACMAHVRRKFEHAFQTDPRAKHFLDRTAALYALEANLKDRGATPEEIRRERKNRAYPILRQLEGWMKRTITKTTPKSPLAAAINYAFGVWVRIARYVGDGRYHIDNNAIERRIRPLTLGRKNYLFSHDDSGAEDNAIFYSLIGTCLENGVEPRRWLTDTLTRLRTDMDDAQLEALLP